MSTEKIQANSPDVVAEQYRVHPAGWEGRALAYEDRFSVTVQRFPSGNWLVTNGVTHWTAQDLASGTWLKTTFYGKSPGEGAWHSTLESALTLARQLADTRLSRGLTYREINAENIARLANEGSRGQS